MKKKGKKPDQITINAEMAIAGRKIRLNMPVPAGNATPYDLLPLFRSLTDTFVDAAIKDAEAEGKRISCSKGCAACCRQMVPISATEARRLRDIVGRMPEERRSVVLERFTTVRQALVESGLYERLLHAKQGDREERITLGMDYLRQRIDCPFLEEESCSIHPERPLACREYLVTTPAINCSAPTPETVECVDVVAKVSNAVAGLDTEGTPDDTGWVPLVLALEWADAHPDRSIPRPGPDLLKQMFDGLMR